MSRAGVRVADVGGKEVAEAQRRVAARLRRDDPQRLALPAGRLGCVLELDPHVCPPVFLFPAPWRRVRRPSLRHGVGRGRVPRWPPRGGFHPQGVAVTLVGAQRVPEFLGHGHGDVQQIRRGASDILGANPADFMSSIIRKRNGVIEVSLGSSKPARWRAPIEGYPRIRRSAASDALRRSRSVQRPFFSTWLCPLSADGDYSTIAICVLLDVNDRDGGWADIGWPATSELSFRWRQADGVSLAHSPQPAGRPQRLAGWMTTPVTLQSRCREWRMDQEIYRRARDCGKRVGPAFVVKVGSAPAIWGRSSAVPRGRGADNLSSSASRLRRRPRRARDGPRP